MEELNNTPEAAPVSFNRTELDFVNGQVELVRQEIHKLIIGQHDMLELLMAGLLSGGHILLEGVPGIAKTLTAKLLARIISVDFSRIQFTPDLMPTDVVGTSVFNLKTSDFTFNRGPLFSNIVLIDEINRSPAKTQSALFEVMEERQITVDGKTYLMDEPFMVIATQNPIEQEGTYKLPEAQLDRFLFKLKMGYPTLEQEKSILKRFRDDDGNDLMQKVKAVMSKQELTRCRRVVQSVHIKDELVDYIATIINNTRNNGDLYLGASPRASLSIMRASKAVAAMNGRGFVTPEDIQFVTYPVLNHRIILAPEREMEGVQTEDVIKEILHSIEVPR